MTSAAATPWPGSCEVVAADDGAAAHRRRRRPRRAGGRGQRRPARHRGGPGRPGAAHRPGRPRARGGVRRGHRPAAVPDQGRPGRARGRSWRSTAPSTCPSWSPSAAADVERGPRPAPGPHERAARATAAWASRRWSTRWCRAPTGPSAWSTTTPDAAGTPRPRRSCWRCPDGGWIVDTPGIRSFGLAHVDAADLIRAFPDLQDAAIDCPRGCSHQPTEPECGLDLAVDQGRIDAARVESYRRLLGSRDIR